MENQTQVNEQSNVQNSGPGAPNVPNTPPAPKSPETPNKEQLIDHPPVEEVGREILKDAPAVVETASEEIKIREYNDYENVGQMLQAASILIESGILPSNITEPEQVVGIMKYGDEVGLSAMTALNNIHMIQGRPTLGIHVITALLKRSGVEYRLIEDYVAVQNGDTTDARTTFQFIDHNLLKQFESKLIEYNRMDDATKEIYRPILEDMREGVVKNVSYYWSQAAGSGLIDKDNWRKDPRNMMRARCLAFGARMVKPEALLGFYETTELAEAKNSEVDIPVDYAINTN